MTKGESAEISYDVENFGKTPTVSRAETVLSSGKFFCHFSGSIIFRHDQGESAKTLCHRKKLAKSPPPSTQARRQNFRVFWSFFGNFGDFREFSLNLTGFS